MAEMIVMNRTDLAKSIFSIPTLKVVIGGIIQEVD